ncbi:MAG: DUF255 domain-containing protein [Planctomycetota bacterium]
MTVRPRQLRTRWGPCWSLVVMLATAGAAPAPAGVFMSATSEPRSGTTPAHTNALANESSPYLLQHAHNPVDWKPWGRAAFDEARERDVPILLSIGYSTCYWCHVMERESFEDEDVAALMNEHFVCIKLDREERPDVDDVYMTALQLMTRSGGWPLNAFLTPPGARDPGDAGLEPFFAGTYFPPTDTNGRPGFPSVLRNIHHAWENDRAGVLEQSGKLADAVREQMAEEGDAVRVDERTIGRALEELMRLHDTTNGGFGGAPKFPQPVYVEYLLDTRQMVEDPAVRSAVNDAVRRSLDAMALGGIHDQVGGGFHRYAVDAEWVVPHFEKMLYDQGQLASLYAKAVLYDRDPIDALTLRNLLDFVSREMTHPGGAFYSAQDAEVDGREGLNYVWTPAQIDDALAPDDAAFAKDVFGLDAGTNFRDPHHPDAPPVNVLVLRAPHAELAEELGMELAGFVERLDAVRAGLLAVRDAREQPGLDDKIIVAWNGLMIAGFAHGSIALGDGAYLNRAERAARAILNDMRTGDGRLLRIARNGSAKQPAFFEDYAYFVQGLLAIHRASAASGRGDTAWFDAATELTRIACEDFMDPATGAWHDTREGQADLLVRARSAYDGALPSPSSVMAHNLFELREVTGDDAYLETAKDLLRALSVEMDRSPLATVNAVRALARVLAADPGFSDELGPVAEPMADAPEDTLRVFASAERVRVTEQTPGEIVLRFEVEQGFHVTAHDPGVPGLVPFSIRVQGNEGVRAEIVYPKGQTYQGSAAIEGGPMRVYQGAFELPVKLVRTDAPWSGRALLVVRFQACTDAACLAPSALELDVAIDP